MKDGFGNELQVGDAVHVKVGNDWIMAHIVKIQNGGLAVTGMPKDKNSPVGLTPDAVVLQIGVGFGGNPGSNQPLIMKLFAPNAVEQIIKSSIIEA